HRRRGRHADGGQADRWPGGRRQRRPGRGQRDEGACAMIEETSSGWDAVLHNPHTWVYVGLLIFVVLVGPKIWKVLSTMLDQRALKIKADMDEAQKLKDEAQALLAEYQRKQRDAMREAEDIIANAKSLAGRQIKEAADKLEQNLARREKASLEKIAQAEAQA